MLVILPLEGNDTSRFLGESEKGLGECFRVDVRARRFERCPEKGSAAADERVGSGVSSRGRAETAGHLSFASISRSGWRSYAKDRSTHVPERRLNSCPPRAHFGPTFPVSRLRKRFVESVRFGRGRSRRWSLEARKALEFQGENAGASSIGARSLQAPRLEFFQRRERRFDITRRGVEEQTRRSKFGRKARESEVRETDSSGIQGTSSKFRAAASSAPAKIRVTLALCPPAYLPNIPTTCCAPASRIFNPAAFANAGVAQKCREKLGKEQNSFSRATEARGVCRGSEKWRRAAWGIGGERRGGRAESGDVGRA
ncbi:hypothetical protein KM043_001416 [Ampulex compressa]|nr:hypothetical protein KM043_001416 [Ampulex compressa]